MKSIKSKILILSMVSVILSMIIVSSVSITNLITHNKEVIKDYTQDMIKDKQQLIKNQIITIDKMIYATLAQYSDIKEAKKQIIYLLTNIRYLENKSGYFFAYTKKNSEYYFAFHGVKTHLNNKKTNILKPDIKGFAFRKALIDSGGSNKFIFYHYAKPSKKGTMTDGKNKIKKKMAFAQYIPELNWTIVTGIYIDDIYKQIDIMKVKNSKQLKSTITQIIIISLLLLILISIIVVTSVKRTIMQPLDKFHNGIDLFFEYLANPRVKVKPIDIDTVDEIGQMSESTNQSIKVSIKMHEEMAQLMHTMDKNVISSETDTQGIISNISEAFCRISGYSKDELIGKSHNIVRHPDMPSSRFEDMWTTIQSGKIWKGDIKNLRKDGNFYWVETIVTPKYSDDGKINGYTAIRYDITNKKEVEDLTANLEIKIEERTADLEETKKEIESIHKHTRESIEYASLIQGAVLPDDKLMANYFPDYFVHWMPKDTVGGDIWLFNELRHEDECLLFFIDCTGHGVPGAFVTMIVKAIEREIISKVLEDEEIDISPAWIMSYFNQTMKKLLKQETKDSLSNAGWDGGIIYYNKQTQILKFAGAETPLFYIDIDGSFNTIKGNRYSVGYKKCIMDYQYKETILEVKEGMKFYCTTDGYLDQNGGEKDFPFGKKRFGNIIKEHHAKTMNEKKEIFIDEMAIYENMIENNDRNDDMTVIAFEIGAKSTNKILYNILKYSGELTQGIIAHGMEIIETKIQDLGMMGKIATISVELLQNMMKYSKSDKLGCREIVPVGSLNVLKDEDGTYYLNAKNIMSIEDKLKVEPKLIEIKALDSSALKKRYRELRKSGENTHEKGGGIGFYEIAKQLSSFEYSFISINDEKFYFEYNAVVEVRRKREV